ncbi:unnamed protein product, partial [Polarella glacialis]
MRIIKDVNEVLAAKIAALRVMNLLMDASDDQLALALVPQLKFFTSIAKKSKEKDRRKRRPSNVLSSRAPAADVETFLAAVCELLDRWGRFYESAGMQGSPIMEIAKARQELVKERVALPEPGS